MIYIDTKSTDPYYNFACEVYFSTEKTFSDDVFLIWHTTPFLIIGRFQNALEEIDAEYAREHGIGVARRLSGGGTCYLDEGGWQFSYLAPSRGNDLCIEFARFVNPVVEFLRSLGLDAALTGRNDITVAGKKVSGNSQYRLGPYTVHHGTLLYDENMENLVRATTPKDYKITSKAIKSVRERVTNIREHLAHDMSLTEFRDALADYITDAAYEITPEDDARIREIADERFRDPAVIFASTPKFKLEKTIHTSGGTFVIGYRVEDKKIADCAVSGDFFAGISAEEFSRALIGCAYTPAAVMNALESVESALFRTSAEELVRGIFE
ncbi:MAG: lipoate--protein ligase [Clostridia bacterium]|nr:lipoate--protein ligase [Clostridia bacterium]MBQ8370574.1 lipoate--protein ligase [Clostridia bacterium]